MRLLNYACYSSHISLILHRYILWLLLQCEGLAWANRMLLAMTLAGFLLPAEATEAYFSPSILPLTSKSRGKRNDNGDPS